MSEIVDPGAQTNAALNRRVFVGIGAGAVAAGGTIATALAQEGLGKPHPPIVPENDPAIVVERPQLAREGGAIGAYAAAPKDATKNTPGVVVVMHIWGVDAQIRDTVRRFAKEGFVAIAPDLFARQSGVPSGDGMTDYTVFRGPAGKLDNAQVNGDLTAGADWIRARAKAGPNERPPRVGVTGFCMGGGITLRQAWQNPKPFDAIVMWYGSVRQEGPAGADQPLTDAQLGYVDKVALPVMGSFGGRDRGPAPEDVKLFGSKLKVKNDLKIYDEAGHAFFDDTRDSYVPSAASDGWARALAFFRSTLTP